MINELLATTCVDAFMLSKHFMPKWIGRFAGPNDIGTFFRWLGDLIALMLERVKENDNAARPEQLDEMTQVCRQVPIGKKRIETGVQARRCGQYRSDVDIVHWQSGTNR